MKGKSLTEQLVDERALVRAAFDLGAGEIGGPLSGSERKLLAKAQTIAKTSRKALDELRAALREGADPLGEIFCTLRSAVERRDTGSFYTPKAILEPMVCWVLDRDPRRVVDPGCGSGRFTQAILLADPKVETVSVDFDPVATLMTRAMLRVLKAKRSVVAHADYTRFRLSRIDGRTAFVGNPPYVRHHELSRDAKERATRLAARLGHQMSQLAGLHAYFFLVTASLAAKGDVGCFVTSSEWMDVNYGSIVRNLLLNGLGGSGIHVVAPDARAFADAMTTAAVAYFEVGSEPERMKFTFSKEPRIRGRLGARGRTVPREELESIQRWSPLLHRRAAVGDGTTLGSIVRVSRGQVTGANDYFVMSRERARELGLEQWCKPAITSAKEVMECGGVIHDDPARLVVLDAPADVDRKRHRMLDRYLRLGESQIGQEPAICDRYVTCARSSWWAVRPTSPPIVASYMARQAPLFALNPDCLVTINVVHGLWPKHPMSDDELRELVEYLNRARGSFVGMGRTYHGGLEKFEPREMEALPIALN